LKYSFGGHGGTTSSLLSLPNYALENIYNLFIHLPDTHDILVLVFVFLVSFMLKDALELADIVVI
jgi:hypothetical protein